MVFITEAEKESAYRLTDTVCFMSPYNNSQPFSSFPLPKPAEQDVELPDTRPHLS